MNRQNASDHRNPKLSRLEAGYYETQLGGATHCLMKCGDGRWRLYRGSEGRNRWGFYRRGLDPIVVFKNLRDARRALVQCPQTHEATCAASTQTARQLQQIDGTSNTCQEIKTYARDLGTYIIGPKHSRDFFIVFNADDHWRLTEPIGRLRDVPLDDLREIVHGRGDIMDKHGLHHWPDWTHCIATGHRLRDLKELVQILFPAPDNLVRPIAEYRPRRLLSDSHSSSQVMPAAKDQLSLTGRIRSVLEASKIMAVPPIHVTPRPTLAPGQRESHPDIQPQTAQDDRAQVAKSIRQLPRTFSPATKGKPLCLWPSPRTLQKTKDGKVILWGVPLDHRDVPTEVRNRIKERLMDDSSGLNVEAPLSVYYVRIESTRGTLYKFGVTRHEAVLPRFERELESNMRVKEIKLLRTIRCASGWVAIALEQGLLHHFDKSKYRGNRILSEGGDSELLVRDVLGCDPAHPVPTE